MPNVPHVPIDWAGVNWLYVAMLAVRFSNHLDRHAAVLKAGFPRCGAVCPIVSSGLCILDVLSAWLAPAHVSHRRESAGHASCRARACDADTSRRPSGEAHQSGHGNSSRNFFATR